MRGYGLDESFEGNEKSFFLLAVSGASEGFEEMNPSVSSFTHCLCVRGIGG